jgi:hypothetical protein
VLQVRRLAIHISRKWCCKLEDLQFTYLGNGVLLNLMCVYPINVDRLISFGMLIENKSLSALNCLFIFSEEESSLKFVASFFLGVNHLASAL